MSVSIMTTEDITNEKPVHFPRIIIPRLTGLESIRYIVRHSISRAIIPPQRNSTIANPVISTKERPKSKRTLRTSPSARVSSTRERRMNMIPRKAISQKNLLRIISRKVLSAILNIGIIEDIEVFFLAYF